jgi:hypothetical protein
MLVPPGQSDPQSETQAPVRSWLGRSLLAWLAVWVLWFSTTRSFHPTSALALIVTTSLIVAYAAVGYLNHLVLIPRFLLTGHRGGYLTRLAASMTLGTGLALAVIRASYLRLAGPDRDPNGALKHFAIDLLGMVVHVGGAWLVLRTVRRIGKPS